MRRDNLTMTSVRTPRRPVAIGNSGGVQQPYNLTQIIMDRRTAIKQLSLLGGAILVAPSCRFSSERISVALNNLDITARQESLLAEISETIIPETDMPGAKNLNLHHFVLVMVDDCRSAPDRAVFQKGLERIDGVANHFFEASFSECTQAQRKELLSGVLDENPEYSSHLGADFGDFREFLLLVKRYSVQGFLDSEYVMTEIFPYVMAPGYFEGCVPVEQEG